MEDSPRPRLAINRVLNARNGIAVVLYASQVSTGHTQEPIPNHYSRWIR